MFKRLSCGLFLAGAPHACRKCACCSPSVHFLLVKLSFHRKYSQIRIIKLEGRLFFLFEVKNRACYEPYGCKFELVYIVFKVNYCIITC